MADKNEFNLHDVHPALAPDNYAPMGSPSGRNEAGEKEWKEKEKSSVYVPPDVDGDNVPGTTASFTPKDYGIAGSVIGGGAGFIERIWPKDKSSLSVIEKIKDLVSSGDPESIAKARNLAEIQFGGGIKKVIPSQEGYQGRASGPKIVGDSGTRNWMLQEAGQRHQVPDAILDLATGKKEAYKLIQEDLKNLERIKNIGGGGYELSGAGRGQLMLPSNVSGLLQSSPNETAKQLEEINKLVKKESGILGKTANLFSKYPILRGGAVGGLGGLELANAIKSARKGDVPQAAISSTGALGALASISPSAIPRVLGSSAALASIPAQFVYEAIKGSMKEREQNVGPKMGYFQRLRESPEVSEEEIRMTQAAGPALSRANLRVPEPIRFAGGLPRTPQ